MNLDIIRYFNKSIILLSIYYIYWNIACLQNALNSWKWIWISTHGKYFWPLVLCAIDGFFKLWINMDNFGKTFDFSLFNAVVFWVHWGIDIVKSAILTVFASLYSGLRKVGGIRFVLNIGIEILLLQEWPHEQSIGIHYYCTLATSFYLLLNWHFWFYWRLVSEFQILNCCDSELAGDGHIRYRIAPDVKHLTWLHIPLF